ncbi:hypothetical protein F444_21696 [Phytophthora nicotianae P1976]|uniref:Uncharacterized protein n=1 Tax=Phytophthora nicotianae P1976 TaxID=1317066 RepID=A0A080Z097_PHYNI|nr:hypothetical protein F444_21696 [Phytophthora nicotianae P1976]
MWIGKGLEAASVPFQNLRYGGSIGWKSKKPGGIETQWSYKTPNGAEVFAGEDAVVRHAIESGLLANSDDEEEKTEDNASPDSENVEDSNIRVLQIDTSAQLSQHSLCDLFGASSGSEVELSDAKRDGVCAETSGPMLRPLSNVKQDVNFVPGDENLSAYESLSFGQGDSAGVVDGDEDAALVVPQAMMMSYPQMDEAFVESLRIGQDGVNKKAAEARANALPATKWTPVSSEFEEASLPYPGLNAEVDLSYAVSVIHCF